MISVLCANPKSNYFQIPSLDIWTQERNAYKFYNPSNPVICHPPCQQWSRLKAFSKPDINSKNLAWWCLYWVKRNGGIFEHPAGSSFFKEAGIPRYKLISVNQHWFGFPATKRTYLYFNKCEPIAYPLNFDAVSKSVQDLDSSQRSSSPLAFNQWLVNCVTKTLTI